MVRFLSLLVSGCAAAKKRGDLIELFTSQHSLLAGLITDKLRRCRGEGELVGDDSHEEEEWIWEKRRSPLICQLTSSSNKPRSYPPAKRVWFYVCQHCSEAKSMWGIGISRSTCH